MLQTLVDATVARLCTRPLARAAPAGTNGAGGLTPLAKQRLQPRKRTTAIALAMTPRGSGAIIHLGARGMSLVRVAR
jgi:hypothetical protein